MYRWGHRMAITSTNIWKDGGGPKIMTNGHHSLVWRTWGSRCTRLEPQVIYFFFFLFCYSLTTCNSMKQCWRQHLHLHLSLHCQTGGCLPKVFFFYYYLFFCFTDYYLQLVWIGKQQWQGGCFHKQPAEHPTPLDQPIVQYGTLSLESITMKMFSSHNWLYI